MSPRILFLVAADYESLSRKGVERLIRERDEEGFFERVLTVHPIARRDAVVELDGVHRIVEYDLGKNLGQAARIWQRLAILPKALRVVWRLCRLIRRERIDVIRATDPYLMGLFAWAVARVMRRPFCVSIHTDYERMFELTPQTGWKRRLREWSRWAPAFVLRRAALVLPIREHLAQWAERHGAPAARVRVIPHGIDVRRFQRAGRDVNVRARYGIPEDAPIVSFVGRLARENFVGDVAYAGDVLARHTPAVTILMGDGPERAALEARIRATPNLADRIRLVGFQGEAEVSALRHASTVSLCPMGGFSLLEACAAGTAVVTYDIDWHREVICDGVTGLVVPAGDRDGLAGAALRLLADAALAHELGSAAKTFVTAHHDLDATSAIKRACYSELLQQHSS